MKEQILEALKADPSFPTIYAEALRLLKESGIISFLKACAEPGVPAGGKDVQMNATEGMRSAGYFEALNDLLYFRERHLGKKLTLADVPMDFGATQRLIATGDITKEELDGIAAGKTARELRSVPITPSPKRQATLAAATQPAANTSGHEGRGDASRIHSQQSKGTAA